MRLSAKDSALSVRAATRQARSKSQLFTALFAAPALIVLLFVTLYPLIVSIWMSLSDVNLGTINGDWEFIGLRNYIRMFESAAFSAIVMQTFIYVVFVVALGLAGGLLAAMTLNKGGMRLSFAVGALMLFVWALPHVVNGSLWKFSFTDSGPINGLIKFFGLEPVPWLVNGQLALLSVALVHVWLVVPFTSAVLRAALLDIPPELLEASAIDGAGPWRQFRYVIYPMLIPTLGVLGVLMVLSSFRSFDLIYVMTTGGPGQASTTLPFLSYTQSFVAFQFGQGAAVAVMAIIIVLPVVWVYLRLRRRDTV